MTNEKDQNLEKSLVECQPKVGGNSVNIDPVPKECADDGWCSQKRIPTAGAKDWGRRKTFNKLGIGANHQCDPIMTGQIINDLDTPNRDVIYRYSRGIRGCDEAMLDLFRNTVVIDEQGKAHTVPIIWASQEKAVDAILQDNVRKDNSLVVDRIRLPMMSIWNAGITFDQTRFTYQKAYSLLPWLDPNGGQSGFFNQEKYTKDTFYGVTRGLPLNINYTLYMWTLYEEDMKQILEQAFLKFSPVAYLQVKGVYWEIIVTLDSTANNMELEPGDQKIRVLKYQFNMTAKTYLPQPIYRLKSLPKDICDEVPTTAPVEPPDFMRMSDDAIKNSIEELKKSIAEIEESMEKNNH